MRAAIVILNWNGKNFLERFLANVIQHSSQAKIYVADNASTDGSAEYLKSHFPSISLIELTENLGYAGGYAKALEYLTEEFLVLLNSDVEVTPNWLDPIIALFDGNDNLAACQPKILQFDNRQHFEYAGAAGGFVDSLGYPFCRGRIFDTLETDNGQYDQAIDTLWATGACLFVRNSIYKKLSGLDSDFFAHMEEIDFCWRAKRNGYSIMVEPKSTVYHVGGGTLARSNPWKTFLNFRNGLELLVKNTSAGQLLYKLPLRLVLDGVAAIRFLISGSPKDLWAIFRAHMAFYGRLGKTWSKRSGNYPTLPGQYRRSIVLDYYLLGKKKFSELNPNDF